MTKQFEKLSGADIGRTGSVVLFVVTVRTENRLFHVPKPSMDVDVGVMVIEFNDCSLISPIVCCYCMHRK